MQEFAAVLGNSVSGLFALLGVFAAWRLRRKDDEYDRRAALSRERRRELIDLYAQAFTSFEQAIKCMHNREPYEVTPERSLVNAKVHLLSSEKVVLAYDDAAEKFENWANLHILASPSVSTVGDTTYTMIQAPDPTQKYKAPAHEAYKALHEAIRVFRQRIQSELDDISS